MEVKMLSTTRNVTAFVLGFATSLLMACGVLYVCNGYTFSQMSETFNTSFCLAFIPTALFLFVGFLVPEVRKRLKIRKSVTTRFYLGTLAIYVIIAIASYLPSVIQYNAWADSQHALADAFNGYFMFPVFFHLMAVITEIALGPYYHPDDIARQKERIKQGRVQGEFDFDDIDFDLDDFF
jgi:DMSO/TMAO reductase YedYZ heme-binding membrane subunit